MALVRGMKVALDTLLHPKAAGTSLSPRAARKAIVLCHSLLTHRGEVSGTRMADEALSLYRRMDDTVRTELFDALSTEFSPDPEAVGEAGDRKSVV